MELLMYPDNMLRAKCSPLTEINEEGLRRAKRMLELMYDMKGVGLAGVQVGWPARIVTLDVESSKKGERVFINPRVLASEGEVEEEEGCLSLPGVWARVRRAERVVVAAYTLQGKRVEIEAEGLLSRTWQHEIDHINGMLFIDRLPPTSLLQIRDKLRELERSFGEKGAGQS